VYVGRQGHVTVPVQSRRDLLGRLEPHLPDGALGGVEHLDREVVRDAYPSTLPEPTARTEERVPRPVLPIAHEHDLRGSASFTPAQEARRKHTAAVRHHEVVGIEKIRKVAKDLVPDRSGFPVEHEKAGGIPLRERLLGDPLRRKLVIEEGNVHVS
jgi:hypothetical protein